MKARLLEIRGQKASALAASLSLFPSVNRKLEFENDFHDIVLRQKPIAAVDDLLLKL